MGEEFMSEEMTTQAVTENDVAEKTQSTEEYATQQEKTEEKPLSYLNKEIEQQKEKMAEQEQEQEKVIPEKYELEIPEGFEFDQKSFDDFSVLAKEMGLSNEEFNKVSGFGSALMTQVKEATVDYINNQRMEEFSKWESESKKKFSEEQFKSAISGVEAMEKFSPNIRLLLDQSGLGNHPEMIKVFEQIGKMTSEDNGTLLLRGKPVSNKKSIYDNTDWSLVK